MTWIILYISVIMLKLNITITTGRGQYDQIID